MVPLSAREAEKDKVESGKPSQAGSPFDTSRHAATVTAIGKST